MKSPTKHTRAIPLRTSRAPTLAAGRAMSGKRARTIARVAAQLAREDAGSYLTLNELSAHALALTEAGFAARTALASGKSAKPHYQTARDIAAIFGAELVERGDLEGMVVGLKLSSGRFTSGAENVFYVA